MLNINFDVFSSQFVLFALNICFSLQKERNKTFIFLVFNILILVTMDVHLV